MTVALNDAYTQYTGTGVRVFFEYGFPVLAPGEYAVLVLVDGQVAAHVLQDTGVVLTVAPPLGSIVELFRWTDVDQLRDFVPFAAFPAAKTEDAVDKLIMLKQEGWFRGRMNLVAVPFLSEVELVNDKGDNAHILIWNEHILGAIVNDAGVFAGEVTQDMPEAGSVVEKPDDFAYFQYGASGPIEQQILTTTHYPIENTDGMDLNISLLGGSLDLIPNEPVDMAFAALDGTVTQILISTGPHDEAADMLFAALDGNVTEVLTVLPPEDEAVDMSFAALDGNITDLLVTALMPEEGMDISIALISGSMDPV
jgi:hypothetical protein